MDLNLIAKLTVALLDILHHQVQCPNQCHHHLCNDQTTFSKPDESQTRLAATSEEDISKQEILKITNPRKPTNRFCKLQKRLHWLMTFEMFLCEDKYLISGLKEGTKIFLRNYTLLCTLKRIERAYFTDLLNTETVWLMKEYARENTNGISVTGGRTTHMTGRPFESCL